MRIDTCDTDNHYRWFDRNKLLLIITVNWKAFRIKKKKKKSENLKNHQQKLVYFCSVFSNQLADILVQFLGDGDIMIR